MSGRTYLIKSYEEHPDIASGRRRRTYTAADEILIETPYVVPEGKWVLQWYLAGGFSWLIGPKWDDIERVSLNLSDRREVLYISDQPFGFISSEEAEYGAWQWSDRMYPTGPQYFHSARQIHKGELGQSVPTPQISFARQRPDLSRKMHDIPRGRDQKRNHIRWARLTAVMEASGLTAEQVLLGFWPFIGWSLDPESGVHGTLLHLVHATSKSDIECSHLQLTYNTAEEAKDLAGQPERHYFIWIRAGLANTILRLVALGYQPTVTQPA